MLYATAVPAMPALPGADGGATRVQALLLAFSTLALAAVLAVARDRLTGPSPTCSRSARRCWSPNWVSRSGSQSGRRFGRDSWTRVPRASSATSARCWLPAATIANILVAIPILLYANEGHLPRWLGIGTAVFTVEQLIETITIIGPPGSFIAPGGPINHYLGGTLTAAFFLTVGIALALPEPWSRPTVDEPAAH